MAPWTGDNSYTQCSQAGTVEKTVQNDQTPSEVWPAANTEDDDTDMYGDCLSPITDENVAGGSSQGQLQISQKIFTSLSTCFEYIILLFCKYRPLKTCSSCYGDCIEYEFSSFIHKSNSINVCFVLVKLIIRWQFMSSCGLIHWNLCDYRLYIFCITFLYMWPKRQCVMGLKVCIVFWYQRGEIIQGMLSVVWMRQYVFFGAGCERPVG